MSQSESALRGEAIAVSHCSPCHSVRDSEGAVAPSLRDLLGRRAGATSFAYSAAMKGSTVIWTREALDRFLSEPREMFPDNDMAFFGMPDPAMRSDLIEFLAFSSEP